jgi:peptide/nickel transport system substrate-binding protein
LPVADLAESWGISQDGKIYNFTLRQGLKWHDGQPLTADDVIFTVEMIRQGNPAITQDLQNFWKSIEVKGAGLNVQFKLTEAFSPFLDYVTFGVLPKHLLNGLSGDAFINSPFNLQPVGTGPFQFERLIVDNGRISGWFTRLPKITTGQNQTFRRWFFCSILISVGALTAYKESRAQGISSHNPGCSPQALNYPNLALYSGRKPEMMMLLFNLKKYGSPLPAGCEYPKSHFATSRIASG